MKRVTEELPEEQFEEMMASEPKSLILKCKPVYNYQSIEFEYEVKCGDDIADMFELYGQLLQGLMDKAPEQPAPARATPVKAPKAKDIKPVTEPKEPLATEAQLRILNDFHIPHNRNVTKAQAQKLIRDSVQRMKAEQEEWKSGL